MDKKIKFSTIEKYYEEMFGVKIKLQEHTNRMQKQSYFVICDESVDFAVFAGHEDGSYTCLDQMGNEVSMDNIYGYVRQEDILAFYYPNMHEINTDSLDLVYKGEMVKTKDIIAFSKIEYDERTGIILKVPRNPLIISEEGITDFYVDEIVYADEEKFHQIMEGLDATLINHYHKNREYEPVTEGIHGIVVLGTNGDGILIDPYHYNKSRDRLLYLPAIKEGIEKRFEKDMEQRATYEMKLYIPLKVNQYLVESDDTKLVDGVQYFNEIREAIKEETRELGKQGLAKDLKNNKVRNKVYSIKPEIEIVNDVLVGATIIKMTKPLTDEEITELKDFVEETMSTGWGDDIANKLIDIDEGHLNILFWNNKDYQIMTESEIQKEEQSMEQPMLGM